MQNYGRARLSEFLGDRVIYRNLAPYDSSLPGLEALHGPAGVPAGTTPRKHEPGYARVVSRILQFAMRQKRPSRTIERLIFVGDTRLLDATAFANLCQAGGWPGAAFIGSETAAPPDVQIEQTPAGQMLYLANRWAALAEFDRYSIAAGLPVDDHTAVVIDLDKTALGARERNAGVIDAARVQAVQDTLAGLLGADFDPLQFRSVYDPLNQPAFHAFTADNQDYLAYICLIVGSRLWTFDDLVEQVRAGRMMGFEPFIAQVEDHKAALPPALAALHAEIYANVQRGDPTPFKAFRRSEYRATLGRFACLDEGASLEQRLREEILITQEVRTMALEWRRRGALLFGLSDKPDEAAIPTPELAAQGWQPLHRAETHAVGG